MLVVVKTGVVPLLFGNHGPCCVICAYSQLLEVVLHVAPRMQAEFQGQPPTAMLVRFLPPGGQNGKQIPDRLGELILDRTQNPLVPWKAAFVAVVIWELKPQPNPEALLDTSVRLRNRRL